jgi:flagellar hook assembly protein FlgD
VWLRTVPNPAAGSLRIEIVDSAGGGTIAILDPAGRLVRRLDASKRNPAWDGRDESGRPVPSGTYLLRWDGDHTGVATCKLNWLR